ncbi:hypothetical protein JCM19237_2588 [Photobacterium aphoticum]|uniref:Uncharacterized protein n=1 Tax=Photobacterium aphoticum TaxID=754436 RepID=A0A090RG39_9GAMM|nr:hypothetical protein JCM19237_2588 [Photobacterium aphoticum]
MPVLPFSSPYTTLKTESESTPISFKSGKNSHDHSQYEMKCM